ncbi:MAG: rhodanese-like domain-containing protein [Flavobacteriaceae bacterium]|nr:rhodanese-like domain-containing protein [Flavobacteriaceae bacterium]
MINRKLAKVLSFRYKILAIIFLVLAGGLVVLPKYEKQEGIQPEALLKNAVSSERYITTDELADLIINQDPSFILIDVREEESYKKYSLPNSINIPLDKLLSEDSNSFLNQDQFDVILFSNDHFYADQAWLICNRLDYNHIRVLKGGLNAWFNTIINPEKPSENQSVIASELYSFRKAASMYFGVAYPDEFKAKPVVKIIPKKKVIPKKKKKKMPVEGGC